MQEVIEKIKSIMVTVLAVVAGAALGGAMFGPLGVVGGGLIGGGLAELFKMLGNRAAGDTYIPKTGLYMLHRGEAVIPASQNRSLNQYSKPINIQNIYTLKIYSVI
ncbi:MAG: hypothetical protein IIB83_04335 [Bacteroidetes bacterium]|nr:hypothetical protein [Bacteroidota bacterium]